MINLVKSLKRSLSGQLLMSLGITTLTISILTLGLDYHLIQRKLSQQVEKQAQSITQSLEFATEGLIEGEHKVLLRRVVQNYATLPAVKTITIVDPQGNILADSTKLLIGEPYVPPISYLNPLMEASAKTGVEASYQGVINSQKVLIQILPFSSVLFGVTGERGLVIAVLDLQEIEGETIATFITSTLVMGGGTLIILAIMAVCLKKIVLNPIGQVMQAVDHSKTTGTFILPPSLPSHEIGSLATAFYGVFQQLEAYEQLKCEIEHRLKVEATLREKSQELSETLTKLQKTQTQLIQTEKMSSLGQMVGGIAHEINNPISFIYGNLTYVNDYFQGVLRLLNLYQETYQDSTPEIEALTAELEIDFLVEDWPKILASMKAGADRIRDIVISLRSFSRLDEAEIKAVDLHQGLESTLLMLKNRLKQEIQVIRKYGQLPLVECYAGQLNQVFLNLLNNAIDALEEAEKQHRYTPQETQQTKTAKPTIVIQTKHLETEVLISIADNGQGISNTVKEQLFDPFFTTKPIGKGTGLGLSVAYQVIVEQHQGEILCHSEIGKGTEFVIKIPLRLKS